MEDKLLEGFRNYLNDVKILSRIENDQLGITTLLGDRLYHIGIQINKIDASASNYNNLKLIFDSYLESPNHWHSEQSLEVKKKVKAGVAKFLSKIRKSKLSKIV